MSFNIIAEVKAVWNWQVLLDDETFEEFCDWFLLANLIRPVAEEAFCLEQTQLGSGDTGSVVVFVHCSI